MNNSDLLGPLDKAGLTPKDGKDFDKQMRKQHESKRDLWRQFLQQHITSLSHQETDPYCFAIIEIGQTKKKEFLPQQNIKGAVREACVLEKINSQMIQTVKPKTTEKEDDQENTEPTYSKQTKGRVMNAVLDATLRQVGALYGLPSEVYASANVPEITAQELDVVAFCRRKINRYPRDIHYALAVRLRATGEVDTLLPGASDWTSYTQAGIAVGKLFSDARRDRIEENKKCVQSRIRLKGIELVQFVADVLTQHLERPTIVLIEAEGWRNERGEDNDSKNWFQLKNEYLLAQRDVLNFHHVPGHNCEYTRDNNQLINLLSVVRLRTGNETPQYITNRKTWDEDALSRDFKHLSGFLDKTVPELLHYFSVGGLPNTQKGQDSKTSRELYMLDSQDDEYGANIAFKHQQMMEIVPFFVRPDFQAEEYLKVLCRVPHYMRISPAWSMGNILYPYPMHLGKQLIDDCLCILGLDD
ncbi:RNaseH domain-containing protein [Scytonema hofmannii]|nr:RNaseH domain-containing protein [Scytonema hofmannii]